MFWLHNKVINLPKKKKQKKTVYMNFLIILLLQKQLKTKKN